jgi:hypothetical protein
MVPVLEMYAINPTSTSQQQAMMKLSTVLI